MTAHEDLARVQPVKVSSNRAFGWTFAAAFLLVGLWPLVSHAGIRTWALVASACFLVITVTFPALLTIPNRLWQQLGRLLNRLVSPIVLAFLFYVVVTPIGALMRAFSKDMRRRLWRRGDAPSYWITRDPPGPKPDSLRNQF